MLKKTQTYQPVIMELYDI